MTTQPTPQMPAGQPLLERPALIAGASVLLLAVGLWLVLATQMSAFMAPLEGQIAGQSTAGSQSPLDAPRGSAPATERGSGVGGSTSGASDGSTATGRPLDPWSPTIVVMTSTMWLVMMLAMMLPAMAPMISLYAALSAKEDEGLRLAGRVAAFVAGYFALWAVFSIAMAMLQLALRDSSFFTLQGTQSLPIASALLIMVAGAYQLTPLKETCLAHCRSPMMYLLSHWRPGLNGAFPIGLHHGLYCVGCCGVFMGLMFVFGAMTLWWMAVLAGYFLAEKLVPRADIWGRAVGVLLLGTGAVWLVEATVFAG